jgi:hypothetical protein
LDGLVASSGANRLHPEGIFMKSSVDASVWFLGERKDVRSSIYLEEVASEFGVQGLELDWTIFCWDVDYPFEFGKLKHYSFKGSKWQRSNALEKWLFLKNAYRFTLTRARRGMIISVPRGNPSDPTRPASFFEPTYDYLCLCRLAEIPSDLSLKKVILQCR